ncbi:uncharacterized protein LOC126374020 [Pectinophora gossypiella]|uniref:uncharacterized protein LOC126374020 n=1 Tax=Pectinophora gossypiella TaxID=13191 RepID=UPI00214F0388|nr:uncharacterized protein LOC126374020 [Pectinophora gossypiella]
MERRKLRRGVQVSLKQKKKLLEYITKHPELISCKVTQDFTYQDSQNLWQSIADECNKLPGATKTWKQWKKTWHDLRSNTKKREKITDGSLPPSLSMLTAAEKEALGLKTTTVSNYQETTEFIPLESENPEDNYQYVMEAQSLSEPESPPETKLFVKHRTKLKNNSSKNDSQSSNNCSFNCDLLAAHEQRKLELKEDYINFKKDYLRQKLKLIKEQTEALKTIAKELSEK